MAAKPIEPAPYARTRHSAPEPSDAVLVQRMGSGDTQAFAELVTRHVAAMSAVARRMLGDDAEAEDVTQDALIKLWRLGPGLTLDAAGVRPWLRRVVSNLAIDRLRSRRRVEVAAELPEVPEPAKQLSSLEGRETSQRVDAALQALPDRQRLALTLFHYEGLSQIEVAAAMGVSDEAVESLLARARRSLRGALAADWRELVSHDDGV